ncbi:SH3 domain signaling protein [Magnaporthiopsis poae ATCC 64411]|uniref:SH3 domain signaling protein n=1 Tax=Magnaporthiopsis poae (strain ATCC 64411 / 73-15) TaxID=644358 RepID=A0A0C4ECJ4_MAGP6|nr:SH3 domain signaling protein [Magnaporthiopsis poae ATCC 64411]
MRPTDFTQATSLGQEPASAPAVVRPRIAGAPSDYFGHGGGGGSGTTTPGTTTPRGGIAKPIGALIAGKKKPPPPPPPKRIPAASKPPEEFVVALYAFPGQGKGDLSFDVGDRIKIVKKTNTADDWWEGEIGGVRGSFPANYCQAV